jgi:hypothetical protein
VIVTLAVLLCLLLLKWKSAIPNKTDARDGSATNAEPAAPVSSSAPSGETNSGTVMAPLQVLNAEAQQNKRQSESSAELWRTPILYYGKVVDESNQPIPGVMVSFNTSSVNEALTSEQYDTGTVMTDDRGIFKIDGVRGIGMVFQLSHPNYYTDPKNLTDYDIRDYPKKGPLPNTEETALIFRMHSKGNPVPLVHRVGGVNVPLNKTPTELILRGQDYKQQIGELVVEASGSPPPQYDQQPFDWDAKISVPGGGLLEFTNPYDFTAPDSGYQPTVELAFPKELVGWTDTVSKSYFVKLPSGFARLNVYIGAKSPLFFSIDYDYNPDGSANLERAQ